MAFKMRNGPQEPKKPERIEVLRFSTEIYDGELIKSVWSDVPEECKDTAYISIEIEYEPYGGGSYAQAFLIYTRPETDEELEKRMKDYESRLKAYKKRLVKHQTWLRENKENIENYFKEQKKKKAIAEARRIAKLEKELARAKAKLEKENEKRKKI